MPACSYGTHFRFAKAHNWYTGVFVPEAMKGPVAFQNTVLVHAANTWAWVRNETETMSALIHRDRAMLRDHLTKHPKDIPDVAIVACLSAAALDDFDPRPGHKEISWVHMRAAREMIQARGGSAAFANTRLGMFINWQDYILAEYETHEPSFRFENTLPASPLVSESSPTSSDQLIHAVSYPSYSVSLATLPRDEIQFQCDEFISFLKRAEELALSQKNDS